MPSHIHALLPGCPGESHSWASMSGRMNDAQVAPTWLQVYLWKVANARRKGRCLRHRQHDTLCAFGARVFLLYCYSQISCTSLGTQRRGVKYSHHSRWWSLVYYVTTLRRYLHINQIRQRKPPFELGRHLPSNLREVGSTFEVLLV